jgi:hypothetical protein
MSFYRESLVQLLQESENALRKGDLQSVNAQGNHQGPAELSR